MEAQATTATANVHLQAPRQVPSQQQPQQHRSSTSPPPSAANAAALSSGTAATSKSASTRSNSIASSTGWTHNSLSPSGRGGHDSHGHTLSPSSSHSGVAAAFAESCSSIQAGGSGGSSCCTAGGAVTRSMDGMTPSAAGVRSTANAQTDQLSFKEANASLANVLSLADNLSADPGSLSHTDPSSDLLVKALSDEASRRGADGEQGHGNWREREQEEDQQQPSRSSLHQHQHHLPIAMSQAVKLSPKASLKAEAAPAALADTASEAPEPSWSRPSSGPASAYTSPAAKNLPLHSHPEGLQVHGHAGLSPPSGLSTTRLSAKGYLMDTATAASGSPHAYHRAMTQQATVALGHSCDVAVSSSPPAGPAAPSIGLLGFPSALGRFGSVPHSTSASAANSASASASGTPDRKLTPSQSGRSTPSLSAASVSTTAQMQQQQHLIASPRPQLVLETHHLQLQTHKPSGRRMINQYIIEDELGRGVHGKVRMAWDTETGERVAVKIVERQSRKRLGGGGQEWSARIAAKQRAATAVATTTAPAQMHKDDATSAASSSASPSSPQTGSMGGAPGDKGKARDNEVDPIHAHVQRLRVGGTDSGEHASGGEDSADTTVPRRAHFALSPPRSPGAAAAARFGPLEHGLPTREEMAEHEALRKEKAEREKARKALLWTTDKKVKREIAIMKKCQHENIVRLREVIDDPQSKKIFMVLEYMAGGEVQWKDEQGRPTLTVDEARRTFRDVVLGLEYLHYQGIIHRDIKPANLLWNEEKHVKISDFGVSHYSYALLVASGGLPSSGSGETNDPSLTDDRELAKTAGSPAFFAPELCLAGEAPLTSSSLKERGGNSTSTISPSHDPVHSGFPFNNGPSSGGATAASAPAPRGPKITKAIDVWALGVTLYCLLFGELPFTAPSEFALFNVIPNDDYKLPVYMGADNVRVGPRKPRWKGLPEWEDEEMDVHPPDPSDPVPDVNETLLSEDARQLRDLIDRLLEKDPEQRIKLEAVKKHPWVTRGLHDAPAWLIATAPEHLPFLEVTHEEVEDALTGFSKIKQRVKRWQSKLFDTFSGGRASRSRSHSQTSSLKPSTGTASDKLTPGSDDMMMMMQHHQQLLHHTGSDSSTMRSSSGIKSPRLLWFGKKTSGCSVPTTPGGCMPPSTTLHRSAAFSMTPSWTHSGERHPHNKAVPHAEVDALLQRIISNSPVVPSALPTGKQTDPGEEDAPPQTLHECRASWREASSVTPLTQKRTSSLSVRPNNQRSSSESGTLQHREGSLNSSACVPLEKGQRLSRAVSITSIRESGEIESVSGATAVGGRPGLQGRRISRSKLGELFGFGKHESWSGSTSRGASRRSTMVNAMAPPSAYQVLPKDPANARTIAASLNLRLDVVGAVSLAGTMEPNYVPASAPVFSSPSEQQAGHTRSSMDVFQGLPPFPQPFSSQPGTPLLPGHSTVMTSAADGYNGMEDDDVNDVDLELELDLSDDDLGEQQHCAGQILRNDGSGWRIEGASRDSLGSFYSDRLTPSVEGGYNLFKAPYTGDVVPSSPLSASGIDRSNVTPRQAQGGSQQQQPQQQQHHAFGQPREAMLALERGDASDSYSSSSGDCGGAVSESEMGGEGEREGEGEIHKDAAARSEHMSDDHASHQAHTAGRSASPSQQRRSAGSLASGVVTSPSMSIDSSERFADADESRDNGGGCFSSVGADRGVAEELVRAAAAAVAQGHGPRAHRGQSGKEGRQEDEEEEEEDDDGCVSFQAGRSSRSTTLSRQVTRSG